jgi:membrane dipeptidase
MRLIWLACILAIAGCAPIGVAVKEPSALRVARLLREAPLIDGHNDVMMNFVTCGNACPKRLDEYDLSSFTKGHSDLRRWKAGGVSGQFLNAGWVPGQNSLRDTLRGFDLVRSVANRFPDRVAIARSSADIRRIHASHRLALLLALEDAERLGTNEATVRSLAEAGLQYDVLAYSGPTALADGHAGPVKFGGLSPLGKLMVAWMQRNGVLVDLSHASSDTARDVLDQSIAPVLFSHSSAASICNVSRNVPDDVLRRLPENGGLVMVSFVPQFTTQAFADWFSTRASYIEEMNQKTPLESEREEKLAKWQRDHKPPPVEIEDVIAHIQHIRAVAGVDHVGLGGDFDGISFTIEGLNDVSTYPVLLEGLVARGWTDQDLKKLMGGNMMRVMDAAAKAAKTTSSHIQSPSQVSSMQNAPAQRGISIDGAAKRPAGP